MAVVANSKVVMLVIIMNSTSFLESFNLLK